MSEHHQIYAARLQVWAEKLTELGLAGSVSYGYPSFTASGTTGHSTIRHLSGWTARFGASALVVSPDGRTLLVVPTGHDLLFARAEFPWISQVESAPPNEVIPVCLRWLGDAGGSRRLGLTGYADLPHQLMTQLAQVHEVVNLDPVAAEIRRVKDAYALAMHRRAAAASDAMIDRFFTNLALDEPLAGGEMMASVEYAARSRGAELAACWLAVGDEGRAAYRIDEVWDSPYQVGQKALIGTYVTYRGYWAHCLRTAFAGDLATSAEAAHVVDLAVAQHAAAVHEIVPGRRAAAVAEAALGWIDQQPAAQLGAACFRQAHFLGLDYAEYPTANAFVQAPCWFSQPGEQKKELDAVLEPGMVMEVHTNFEHEKFGLVVMGDVYLVTESGSERLTGAAQRRGVQGGAGA